MEWLHDHLCLALARALGRRIMFVAVHLLNVDLLG